VCPVTSYFTLVAVPKTMNSRILRQRAEVRKTYRIHTRRTRLLLLWCFVVVFTFSCCVVRRGQRSDITELVPRPVKAPAFLAEVQVAQEHVVSTHCVYPPVTAIVVVFHEARFPNIDIITAEIKKSCFIEKLIIWNNNNDVTFNVDVDTHFSEVINSPRNIGTRAKYEACALGETDSCYVVDDDWLPIHLDALYYVYLRHNSSSVVVLTNAATQFMDFSYTFHERERNFRFAWLGVGSFIPKRFAQKFLDLAYVVPREFLKHEDMFFTFFLDNAPIVLSAEITPLEHNTAGFSMSAQPVYLDFQRKAWFTAFNIVVSNPMLFPAHETSDVELALQDARAVCATGQTVVVSNVGSILFAHTRRCKSSVNKDKCLFDLNDDDQQQFKRSSYKDICDESLQSCFHFTMLWRESYIGYVFIEPIQLSKLTMILQISTRRSKSPEFHLEVVHIGRTHYERVNYDTTVRFDEVSATSHTKTVKIEFMMRQRTIKSLRLRINRDYHAPVSICEMLTASGDVNDMAVHGVLDAENNLSATQKLMVKEDSIDLILAVTSSIGNHLQRLAVRKTLKRWSSLLPGVRLVFFVGSAIDEIGSTIKHEMSTYGDIVALSVDESYDALTLRTLKIFEWVSQHYRDADFLMKMDDDTFVQLDKLVDILRTFRSQLLYMGHFFHQQEVYHDVSEKNFEPFFDARIYPPYASGSGYILSMRLVQFLVDSWHTTGPNLKLFRNEDASVGMWLLGLNITRVHRDDFWPEPPSQCQNTAILLHRVNADQMLKLYENYAKIGMICER